MNNSCFVKTSDIDVANKLRNNGLQELPKEGQLFCFINNGKLNFDIDKKKVIYTDKMCM